MSIVNPLADSSTHACMVMAELSPEIFEFFFARAPAPSVFASTRGARQALIATFFVKFHAECLRRGIQPKWLPEQDDVISAILTDMNFKPKPKPKTKKSDARTATV